MKLAKLTHKKPHKFHIIKRLNVDKKKMWLVRIASFVVAFLLAGVITSIIKPGSFMPFTVNMFLGVFDPNDMGMLFNFLGEAAILLLITISLLPAFKMKYWNIGAEGTCTIGCLVTALITSYCPSSMNSALVIIIAIIGAVAAGMLWSFIPAIFKAKFNTNETLFTLMMNYVAILLTTWVVTSLNRGGSGTWGLIRNHQLPEIDGVPCLFIIIFAVIITVLMILYIKKTKHGYEIEVIGGSDNTAKYIGINKSKVIVRSLLLSGALCGFVGFLIVAGKEHTLNPNVLNSRGFTGVLIAWLGHFSPVECILYSFLSAFFSKGAFNAASFCGMDSNIFSGLISGIFFLIVVVTEFFVSYKIARIEDNSDTSNVDPAPPIEEIKDDLETSKEAL